MAHIQLDRHWPPEVTHDCVPAPPPRRRPCQNSRRRRPRRRSCPNSRPPAASAARRAGASKHSSTCITTCLRSLARGVLLRRLREHAVAFERVDDPLTAQHRRPLSLSGDVIKEATLLERRAIVTHLAEQRCGRRLARHHLERTEAARRARGKGRFKQAAARGAPGRVGSVRAVPRRNGEEVRTRGGGDEKEGPPLPLRGGRRSPARIVAVHATSVVSAPRPPPDPRGATARRPRGVRRAASRERESLRPRDRSGARERERHATDATRLRVELGSRDQLRDDLGRLARDSVGRDVEALQPPLELARLGHHPPRLRPVVVDVLTGTKQDEHPSDV